MFSILRKNPKQPTPPTPNSYAVCHDCSNTIDYYDYGLLEFSLSYNICSKETNCIRCIGLNNKGCGRPIQKIQENSLCVMCRNLYIQIESNKLIKQEKQEKLRLQREAKEIEEAISKANREEYESKLLDSTPGVKITFEKIHKSSQVVVFCNGKPIGRYYDKDGYLFNVSKNDWHHEAPNIILTMIQQQSKHIETLESKLDRLESKFDKLIDMVEFSPEGGQCQEASQRFTENVNKII